MTVPHSQQAVISLTGLVWTIGRGSPIKPPTNPSYKRKDFNTSHQSIAKSSQQTPKQLIGNSSHHSPFSAFGSGLAGWEGIAKENRVAYEAALENALEAALEGKKKFGKRTTQPCPCLPSRLVRESAHQISAGGRR